MQEKIICVVGNPNCGKTTLFNELTGSHQEVGNWPGVTVDKKTGRFTHKGTSVEIVDLPGIYSITPSAASGDDERISRDYILTGEAQAVLNIVDASNLERNLFLTAQLIEMRVPMLVVVNMLDIAAQHKIDVDLDRLSEALGCPVVGLVASKSTGVSELKDAILDFLAHPVVPPMQVKFDARIEEKLDELETTLKAAGLSRPRWFAGQLLESASGLDKLAPGIDLNPLRASVERFDEERFSGDLDIALASCRYDFVDRIAEKAVKHEARTGATLSEKIDRIVLNRWLGLPIFLFIMYLMFLFTQNAGAAFIDFFDIFVGGVMVTGFGELLASLGVPEFLKVLLADGVGGACRPSRPSFRSSFPLPLPRSARRFGLHGACGVRDGPLHAHPRTPGQSLRPPDCRFRLQRTGHHGRANNGPRSRPHHHGTYDALYELRRATACLRAFRDGVLPDERPESRFLSLYRRHCRGGLDGLCAQASRVARRSGDLRNGNPALPHPDRQRRHEAHLGARQELHAARGRNDRDRGRGAHVLEFPRHRRHLRQRKYREVGPLGDRPHDCARL